MKRSVLVVDDQLNWRSLLTELLEDDFEVTSVSGYEDALKEISERDAPFHVIVTDMRLVDSQPGNEDGLNLAEKIIWLGNLTKLIVITGYPTIRSAKRALGKLAVYEYLEKKPADGTSFDIAGFLRAVHRAAEEAESERPHGLTEIKGHILLLVPEQKTRNWFQSILNEKYKTETIENYSDLSDSLQRLDKIFGIILVSEALFEQDNKEFLNTLQETQPQAKIVLVLQRKNDIVSSLKEVLITNVISASDNELAGKLEILDVMQQSLTPGLTKYILPEIVLPDGSKKSFQNESTLDNGQIYQVVLTLQDNYRDGAFPLSIINPKANFVLRLTLIGEHIAITPGSEIYWDISSKPVLEFEICPQVKGKKTLLLDIRQGYRLAAKKQYTLFVN